jgi:adenylate cyclase
VITGALFSSEQVWPRPAMAPLPGLPFLPHLAIKTVFYLLIVLVGLAIGAGLFPAPAEPAVGLPTRHQDVLFSFAVVLAIRFIDDINRLLGQNVLLNFITGHYYRPRLEQRVFLFIDIAGSTALAERLEEFAFHCLVNRFVSISLSRS